MSNISVCSKVELEADLNAYRAISESTIVEVFDHMLENIVDKSAESIIDLAIIASLDVGYGK